MNNRPRNRTDRILNELALLSFDDTIPPDEMLGLLKEIRDALERRIGETLEKNRRYLEK